MTKHPSIPTRALPRVVWQRLVRELRTRTAPRTPQALQVGASVEEIAAQLRTRQHPRFFGRIPEQAVLIGRFFPDAMWTTLDEADSIRMHCFDLLGSGEIQMDRELDWHVDFKSGHRWPLDHHTRLVLGSPGGGFDVKVPWELSRFYHGVRLGQAYLYTENEEYAEELVLQIAQWIEANPYEFGVNWAGPMDVAIRAVNWIWAIYCILESRALTDTFLALWLTSMRQHGEYLSRHLEDGWPRTNHLIANLTGLAYIGIMFPEFREAARWQDMALVRLWEEVERQVYPDGMNYESSTSYHRLVTEMILSVAALCLTNSIEIPDITIARLKAMLDVIMNYTQPDGLAPQIGDADDGRLHRLTVHADPCRAANDHRHLLALGSLVLERESAEWAGFADPLEYGWSIVAGGEWQDAFWFFPSDAAARYTDLLTRTTPRPEGAAPDDWVKVTKGVRVRARALARHPLKARDVVTSREFEAGGLYIMRDQDFHLVIDAGDVGQHGAGGHAHNDTLSFTLCAYGRPFLIDPGSYLYTSNPDVRNLFRSTAYHNTLQADGHEINRLPENGELFRLSDDSQVTLHRWVSQPAYDLLDATHTGYTRLNPGLLHRRQVWFDKTAHLWVLHDHLGLADGEAASCSNGHVPEAELALRFHFAPLLVRVDRTNNVALCEADSEASLLLMPLGDFPLEVGLDDAWYSPRYGVRQRSPVAKFSGRAKLPADLVLLIYPHQETPDLQMVRNVGRSALVNMRKSLSPSARTPIAGRPERDKA